ncbi:hypothetical protein GW17_00038881 [Ensete ventricosum]|nr:hypothetical protein GW17_00038881 [Ensete ventricosum]
MPEACESGKLDLCQEKFVMVEAQDEMCPRHMSQENLTSAKRTSPLQRPMTKCVKGMCIKKFEPCQEKSIMVEIQGKMCPRRMSRENST